MCRVLIVFVFVGLIIDRRCWIIGEQVIGFEFPVTKVTYTEKDVMLYALSIGAAKNPTDPADLKFAYENRYSHLLVAV
jgi:hypothetical protein